MLEDLYVSETLIKIRYEFKNESASDISTIVAFPIPPVDFDVASNSDLFRFSTLVNGHAVTTEVEKKAVTGKNQDDQEKEKVQLTYFWRQTFPAQRSSQLCNHTHQSQVAALDLVQGTGWLVMIIKKRIVSMPPLSSHCRNHLRWVLRRY